MFFKILKNKILLPSLLALFIIPSFRTIDITFTQFIYFSFIIASILIIIDRLLPDITRGIRSFIGMGISMLSNPNLL